MLFPSPGPQQQWWPGWTVDRPGQSCTAQCTPKHSADHRPAGPATTLLWRRHPPTLTIIMLSAMFLSSLLTDYCTVLNVFLWHQTNNNYPVTMFMMSICDVSKHQKVQTTQEKLSCNTSRPCHGPWAAVHHAPDLHNNKLYWLNFQLHNFYEWIKYHCSFSCNTQYTSKHNPFIPSPKASYNSD